MPYENSADEQLKTRLSTSLECLLCLMRLLLSTNPTQTLFWCGLKQVMTQKKSLNRSAAGSA